MPVKGPAPASPANQMLACCHHRCWDRLRLWRPGWRLCRRRKKPEKPASGPIVLDRHRLARLPQHRARLDPCQRIRRCHRHRSSSLSRSRSEGCRRRRGRNLSHNHCCSPISSSFSMWPTCYRRGPSSQVRIPRQSRPPDLRPSSLRRFNTPRAIRRPSLHLF